MGQQERATVSIIGCDGIHYNLIFKYGCGHSKEVESLYEPFGYLIINLVILYAMQFVGGLMVESRRKPVPQ